MASGPDRDKPATGHRPAVKPGKMMKEENEIKAQRAKAIKTAEEMISGKVGIIAGARIMSGLRFDTELPEDDEDFLALVAIDSETDDLPVGSEREQWWAEALREKDIEIQRCEERYRQDAIDACERLILKLTGEV